MPVFVGLLKFPSAAIILVDVAARGHYLDRRRRPAAATAITPGALPRACRAMPWVHCVVSLLIAATRDVLFGLAAAAAATETAANRVAVCSLALTSADPAWTSRAWNPGRS